MKFSPAKPRVGNSLLVLAAIAVMCLSATITGASGPDGRVRGFVTDSGSSAPISGASVRIEASDLPWVFETVTDSAGYFEVALPAHRYDITSQSPSYLRNASAIAVGSGQTTWSNMTLTPAAPRSARLQGYVTDRASGAPVTVGGVAAQPPWWSTTGYANESSVNASGYFEMNLVPSYYEVSTQDVIGYFAYTDYPVSLGTGQVLWYNISLDSNEVNSWINGTISDYDTSAAIAGAQVTARVDGHGLPPATTDATGFYSLQVPSGTVEIAADASGYAPATTSTYVWSFSQSNVDLSLMPLSRSVRGYVRDGVTGAALSGVTVTVDHLFFTGYFDQATTDATGYYKVSLPDDYFIVRASAPAYALWASLALFYSNPNVWLNATLWPIISRVSGYLVDGTNGSRIPGMIVQAADLRTSYVVSGTSDATGFFSFALPPSPAITIWVYAQGPYAGNIVYAGTRPYATTWVNITLGRLASEIEAKVTDALTGLPVSGASVIAAWYYGSDVGFTNASGGALLGAPAGVTVYVTVFASGYLTWSEALTFASGTNPLLIPLYPDLTADVRVRGYITDAASSGGISGATVEASGYDGVTSSGSTNGAGYYEFWIVAQPQTVRATQTGYSAAKASVNPATGETIWVNLTLALDAVAPRVRSFTATPSTGIESTNPTTLLADVNETSLERADMSILMLHSTSGNIGTFVSLERFDPSSVSMTQASPGSYSVSSSWDTRTDVARLYDGVVSVWWPVVLAYGPFLGVVSGYWDNSTLTSPVPSNAVFDTRDGRLLFVVASSGFIDPRDQPSSTFAPFAYGMRVDLTNAAILGATLVTASALQIGSLRMGLSSVVPSGEYAALLDLYDAAGHFTQAVVLMRTAADTIAPVASAGIDLVVDEDSVVTFDGTASTDNVGVVSYAWGFMDGTTQTLQGATATYVFATPGTYLVTLTVQDADGNLGTDTLTVTVRDVTSPTVSSFTPSDGAKVSGAVAVRVSADDNVAVVRVEFFVDGVSVGNDTTSPWEFAIPSALIRVGNRTIGIVAYDAAGNSVSDLRHVTVIASAGGDVGGLAVLVLSVLALLVLAVVAVLLVLMRRRRPRMPMSVPPPALAPIEPPPTLVETAQTPPATPAEEPPELDPDSLRSRAHPGTRSGREGIFIRAPKLSARAAAVA